MKILYPFLLLFVFTQYGCVKDCSKSNSCELQPETGNCEALIPKYYFDQEEGKCKEFIWGGCEGVVPFDSMEECEDCDCPH